MKVPGSKALIRYLTIYGQILGFTLKSLLEYRLNFFLQLWYGPAYVAVLFMIMQTVFTKTPTLAGWSKVEVTILFATFHALYTFGIMLFGKTIRHYLSEGISSGEVDWVLLKPLRPQFLLTFSRPELQHVLLVAGAVGLFSHAVGQLSSAPLLSQWLGFSWMLVMGLLIVYFSLSTYMTLGFMVTRARQVIELYDKTSDYSQYPTPIFPASIQIIFFTILPTAFFGYLPTLFLLGKGSYYWPILATLTVVIFAIINQAAWKRALERYTSASS